MLFKKILVSCIVLCSSHAINANELRHQFVNPNFGGNPFNAAPLLNNANSQNDYSAPVSESGRLSSAESFKNRLDRAIFSRLSRELVANAFSSEDGSIVEGNIETGLNSINIEEEATGTIVTITDNETGESTVIEVPRF